MLTSPTAKAGAGVEGVLAELRLRSEDLLDVVAGASWGGARHNGTTPYRPKNHQSMSHIATTTVRRELEGLAGKTSVINANTLGQAKPSSPASARRRAKSLYEQMVRDCHTREMPK